MTVEIDMAQYALQTGGPIAILAYFLADISKSLGELKGLLQNHMRDNYGANIPNK